MFWSKFPAFCLPSLDCSRFCLQQPGVISAQGAWWEQLGLAVLGAAQLQSLIFCGYFPTIFTDPGCLPGPEDATTSNTLINLEGEMICLSVSTEPTRTSVGFYQQRCWKKKEPRWDPWPFPALLHPEQPTACSGKASAHPGSKIRNLLQGHSYFLAPKQSSVQRGMETREEWVQRVSVPLWGFPTAHWECPDTLRQLRGSCRGVGTEPSPGLRFTEQENHVWAE